MSFIIDPETLNASAREWTTQGKLDEVGPIYIVQANVADLRVSLPDLPHESPGQILGARRWSWEAACEKAIAYDRPMPV